MNTSNGTDSGNGAALAVRDYDGLSMAVAPAEAKRRVQELQAFVASVMVKDQDYGVIPGTDKPTLLQPGAQKLAEIYGLVPHFRPVDVVKDWDRGFFYFEFCCTLTSRRDGSPVGEGMGSCNSRESKYAGRWVPASELPPGLVKESLQKREGARWCFASELPAGFDKKTARTQERVSKTKGTKYTVWQVLDTQYLIPNPDPYSLVNTLQKMAAKRAYIHAVIGATRSAGIFTQDVEDLPVEAFGEASAARSWEREEGQDPSHPAPDAKAADQEKRAAELRERLEAAANEGELKSVMTEIGKAGLGKPYLDALREVAKKSRDAMRAAAAPASAGDAMENDANEDYQGAPQ